MNLYKNPGSSHDQHKNICTEIKTISVGAG